jgi:hypothetical protein
VKRGYHSHGGTQYISPSAGSVVSRLSNVTLPSPDHSYDAGTDLCSALGGPEVPHNFATGQTTIEGTFLKTGLYTIYVVAADAANPSTSGFLNFYVTSPNERPNATETWPFVGKFAAGGPTSPAHVQTVCDAAHDNGGGQVPAQTCDMFRARFHMIIGAKATWVNLTYEPDPTHAAPQPVNVVKWVLLQNGGVIADGKGVGSTFIEPLKTIDESDYELDLSAEQGGNFDFAVKAQSKMDRDPLKYY